MIEFKDKVDEIGIQDMRYLFKEGKWTIVVDESRAFKENVNRYMEAMTFYKRCYEMYFIISSEFDLDPIDLQDTLKLHQYLARTRLSVGELMQEYHVLEERFGRGVNFMKEEFTKQMKKQRGTGGGGFARNTIPTQRAATSYYPSEEAARGVFTSPSSFV